MSHLLHHFLWLLRRFRRALLIYFIAWCVILTAVWTVPQYFYAANVIFSLHGALAAVAVGLVLAVVWQDPAPGTDTFWRTRPPRWRAVWSSQLAFTFLCVAGPFAVCWLVNGLMLGCNAQQWQHAAQDIAVILSLLLAWAGIVSFTRGWYSLLAAGLVAYGVYMLGLFFVFYFRQPVNPQLSYAWTSLPQWMAAAGLLPGVVGLLVWGLGLRGHGRLLRGSMLCVILAGGPLALWSLMQPQPAVGPTLELVRSDLATESERRAQRGNLVLRDLPPGTAWLPAIGHTVFRHVESDRIRILNPPRSNPGGYELAGVRYYPPGIENHHPVFATLPVASIHGHLGAGTQLHSTRQVYGSSEKPPVPGWYVSWNKDLATPITVTGSEHGHIYRLTPLASVPLEAGASAAGRGTRLRVHSIKPAGQQLHILADMHFASGLLARFLPPEGGPMPGNLSWIPVLHFPSGEFAILAQNAARSPDPRSLITTSLRLELDTFIPAAEAIQGRTFTPELLHGARLHLFTFITQGNATVVCRDQVFTPASAPASPATGEIPTLLARLTGQRDKPALAAAQQLSTLGPAAARALLAHEWPLHTGLLREPADYGTDFWKKLITPEVLPDLTAAMQRDSRWIPVAWITGHEDLAAAPALGHLKNARGILPAYLLASAARIIQPADYPHLTRALPGTYDPGYGLGTDHARALLWQRLRALPGFDWQTPARAHWRAAWLTDNAYYSTAHPLRAAAALAGEATAFNSLLEDEQAPNTEARSPYNDNFTPDDWAKLHPMVEGLPAAPATRPAWLRQHRGHFMWDETTKRYRIPTES